MKLQIFQIIALALSAILLSDAVASGRRCRLLMIDNEKVSAEIKALERRRDSQDRSFESRMDSELPSPGLVTTGLATTGSAAAGSAAAGLAAAGLAIWSPTSPTLQKNNGQQFDSALLDIRKRSGEKQIQNDGRISSSSKVWKKKLSLEEARGEKIETTVTDFSYARVRYLSYLKVDQDFRARVSNHPLLENGKILLWIGEGEHLWGSEVVHIAAGRLIIAPCLASGSGRSDCVSRSP